MSGCTDRAAALVALLALTSDLEDALDAVRRFEMLDQTEFVLDRTALRRALEAFSKGELSAELLERWAEAVHTADDIELDPADREFLADALFELSTPEIFGAMGQIVADLRRRDRGAGHDQP